MSKFKILKILCVTTTATLFTNVAIFAKEKYKTKIQENEGIKVVQQQKDAIVEQKNSKKDKSVKNKKQFKEDENKKTDQKKSEKDESKTEYYSEAETAAETEDDSNFKENETKSEKNENKEVQILKGKKTNICGIDFMRVLTDKYKLRLDFSIYNGCIIFLITGKEDIPVESKTAGNLEYWFSINSDEAPAHKLEHLLVFHKIENREKNRKNGRIFTFYSDYNNNKAKNYSNALTGTIDIRNNLGVMTFLFAKELFEDQENFKNFCKQFLGNPTFMRDGNKLFKREVKNKYYGEICGRVLMEMYKNLKHSKEEGTIQKINKEEMEQESKLKYDTGGIYEKMIDTTFKDVTDFYEKYISNGTPILFLYGNNYNEIKKPLAMFKENLLDKKKKCNIPEKGEDKFKGDYIKFPISPETSKETGYFEFTTGEEGNKKIEKTKQKAVISKDVYDFNLLDKFVLTCLKGDFFERRIDLKKYGFKKIVNGRGEDGFFLDIFGDDKNNFEEKNIKEILNSIKKDIIKNIEEKGIDFKKDINKEFLKELKKRTKEYNYIPGNIAKDITRSYFLEKTPFSKKLFKLNKEGKLENNFDNFEEYIKKHCARILKKLLKEKIKLIQVFEEKEGNYDVEKDFKFNNNTTYLPYEFPLKNSKNFIKEIPEIMLCEEILADYIFIPFIEDEGLIYESFHQSRFLNLFMRDLCDLERKNIKNFFDKDFKKHLDELNKKLKNKSLDNLLDLKINSFKDIIKIAKTNLEKSITPYKNHIENLKSLLNKKEIYIKEIKKIAEHNKSNIKPFLEASALLKFPKEEYEKTLKKEKELRKHILKLQEWEKILERRLKNNAKKYDKQTTKEYQKILRKTIKNLEYSLKIQIDGIKKLETMEKIFNKKDSVKTIREGAKEKINKLKIYNFDKFNKEQENKFKNKKIKNNIIEKEKN